MEDKFVYSVRDRNAGQFVDKNGRFVPRNQMLIYQNIGPAKAFVTRFKRMASKWEASAGHYYQCDPLALEVVTFRLVEESSRGW